MMDAEKIKEAIRKKILEKEIPIKERSKELKVFSFEWVIVSEVTEINQDNPAFENYSFSGKMSVNIVDEATEGGMYSSMPNALFNGTVRIDKSGVVSNFNSISLTNS